jgi:steroid delta-isomerase-like uncharacterized protein
MAIADELIAPACIAWDEECGPDQFKELFAVVRAAFPNLRFSIEDVLAEGDKVAIRFVERGTHQGSWMGIPPTGNSIVVPGVAIFQIANGQIVHQWSHNDFGAEMRQLGARIVPGATE